MTEVIGVIPARYASTRFPGKPLAEISGKPMILWVAERAQKASALSRLLIATDDPRIADVVANAGFEFVMTDSDLPSGSDRIHAAIKALEKSASARASDGDPLIVNIQGDEPLLDPQMINELVAPLLLDSKLEMSTLAHEISHEELISLNSVKVVCTNQGDALYFSRFPIPYSREIPVQGPYSCLKHVGLYAYRRSFLKKFCETLPHPLEVSESLEQLRALAMGARLRVVTSQFRSMGVDTREDLVRIENLYKRGDLS